MLQHERSPASRNSSKKQLQSSHRTRRKAGFVFIKKSPPRTTRGTSRFRRTRHGLSGLRGGQLTRRLLEQVEILLDLLRSVMHLTRGGVKVRRSDVRRTKGYGIPVTAHLCQPLAQPRFNLSELGDGGAQVEQPPIFCSHGGRLLPRSVVERF